MKLSTMLFLIFLGASSLATANPLKTAPLPVCGPVNADFKRLLSALSQAEVWRGTEGRGRGHIRLTVGKGGTWSMFFHSIDAGGTERVCLIARGFGSRESFGRPV